MSDKTEIQDKSVFGKSIPFPKSNVTKHNSFILGSGSVFCIVAGRTGCGKSSVLLQMVPNFGSLKYVIICTCIVDNKIHQQIEKYCETNNIQINTCNDVQSAQEVIENILEEKKPTDHVLCIVDDFISMKNNRGNDDFSTFTNTVFSWFRNYNFSAIMITQKYTSISTQIRTNANLRLIFAMDSIHSLRSVSDDSSAIFYNKPYTFFDVYNDKIIAGDNIHNYMILRTTPMLIGYVSDNNYTQIFPEQKINYDRNHFKVGTGVKTGLSQRSKLYAIAKDLGFKSCDLHDSTINEIRDFIRQKSAEGEKNAGNSNPEIKKILDEGDKVNTFQLNYSAKRYIKTPTKRNLVRIENMINQLLEQNIITDDYVEIFLHKYGLQNLL